MSAEQYLTLRRVVGASQTVAYTGTAGTTTKLPTCKSVYVWVSTVAYVRISTGTSGTAATTSDVPLPANIPIILPIQQPTGPGTEGAQVFVSAVQASSGGNLYVQPLAD